MESKIVWRVCLSSYSKTAIISNLSSEEFIYPLKDLIFSSDIPKYVFILVWSREAQFTASDESSLSVKDISFTDGASFEAQPEKMQKHIISVSRTHKILKKTRPYGNLVQTIRIIHHFFLLVNQKIKNQE